MAAISTRAKHRNLHTIPPSARIATAMSSSSSSSSGGSPHPRKPLDPISRTALRYTLSPREYQLLHEYLISRAPVQVQKRTPKPKRFEKLTSTSEGRKDNNDPDSNVAALRTALRVFVGVYVGFKGWEIVTRKLAERRGRPAPATTGKGVKNANLRLALSFSSLVLFHKLLHRFFRRLRTHLLQSTADVANFRKRNPGISRLLTSPTTPAIGAAFSGLCLAISPADQLRVTIAIYTLTRSLEFLYNALEFTHTLWGADNAKKPWWFGSWLLMPLSCGQLLHAFVFDRDCFPAAYGSFILQRSPHYIHLRPANHPATKPWPKTFDIVDALAACSTLRWPPFISPILSPSSILHPRLAKVSPLIGPAHPGIKHTSCAILHPSNPSCVRAFLKYYLSAFPSVARFFALIYGGFALLAYKALIKNPSEFLNKLSGRILRMAVFVTSAIGTSWASICLFNNLVPRTFLPTQRWFLGGALGGLWAFVARNGERSNFLYSFRLSVDSLWKVGRKRGWWRGVRNGDVLVFVAGLAVLGAVYEREPSAVRGALVRKVLGVGRGEGWVDRAAQIGEGQEKKEGVVAEKVGGDEMKEKGE